MAPRDGRGDAADGQAERQGQAHRRRAARRRFVQGLALAGGAAVIGRPVWSRAQDGNGRPTVLSGDRFDLTIGEQPFNVTGKARIATSVNGSVPAPILRLREGDMATFNV